MDNAIIEFIKNNYQFLITLLVSFVFGLLGIFLQRRDRARMDREQKLEVDNFKDHNEK